MDERDWLAERFEEHRTRLRAVAYRMLGSLSEADDAVQEAWLRLSRTDPARRRPIRGSASSCTARSSTAPPGSSPRATEGRSRSAASPSGTAGSSPSTSSPTPERLRRLDLTIIDD